jgi:hypothetical protein
MAGTGPAMTDEKDALPLSFFQNLLDNFGFSDYRSAVPFLQRGRLAIVTDAERDAVDADALLTNSAEADGQVVWS